MGFGISGASRRTEVCTAAVITLFSNHEGGKSPRVSASPSRRYNIPPRISRANPAMTPRRKFESRLAVVEDSDWFAVELPVWGLPLNSPGWRSSEESRGSESENEPVSGLSMDKVVRGIALILTYVSGCTGIARETRAWGCAKETAGFGTEMERWEAELPTVGLIR